MIITLPWPPKELSAHPDRKLAQAMLASIAATDGAPARADVLAAVAERLKG